MSQRWVHPNQNTSGLVINPKKREMRNCAVCSMEFETISSASNKTCGKELCVKTATYHHYKVVEYYNKYQDKIVILESGWEEKIAIFLDENDIEWIRPKYTIPWISLDGKPHKYYPDFYLPKYNVYVDPKNERIVKKDKEKLDYLIPRISLIYGSVEHIKEEVLKLIKG